MEREFRAPTGLPLGEIKRGEERDTRLHFQLEDHGDARVIDGQMVLAYRTGVSKEGKKTGDILVVKKKNLFVLFNGHQIYRPHTDPAGEDYGPFFVTLKPDRASFFIEEQYQVLIEDLFIEYGVNKVELTLCSRNPISNKRIPGDIDFSHYLRTGEMMVMQ